MTLPVDRTCVPTHRLSPCRLRKVAPPGGPHFGPIRAPRGERVRAFYGPAGRSGKALRQTICADLPPSACPPQKTARRPQEPRPIHSHRSGPVDDETGGQEAAVAEQHVRRPSSRRASGSSSSVCSSKTAPPSPSAHGLTIRWITNRELGRIYNRVPQAVVGDSYEPARDNAWFDSTTRVRRDEVVSWGSQASAVVSTVPRSGYATTGRSPWTCRRPRCRAARACWCSTTSDCAPGRPSVWRSGGPGGSP